MLWVLIVSPLLSVGHLISTHNICFCGRIIKKYYSEYSSYLIYEHKPLQCYFNSKLFPNELCQAKKSAFEHVLIAQSDNPVHGQSIIWAVALHAVVSDDSVCGQRKP